MNYRFEESPMQPPLLFLCPSVALIYRCQNAFTKKVDGLFHRKCISVYTCVILSQSLAIKCVLVAFTRIKQKYMFSYRICL